MTDTNPVGTEAKRNRIRELGGSLWTEERTQFALDGLDIAEEIVRAEQVVEWLAGREAYVLLDRDLKWWRYWRVAADKARWGALAEWDEWKREGDGD